MPQLTVFFRDALLHILPRSIDATWSDLILIWSSRHLQKSHSLKYSDADNSYKYGKLKLPAMRDWL